MKARSAAAPGPNGVPYKVNKKYGKPRKYLWRLLKVVWRKVEVPASWKRAEGVYIPTEENSSTLGQFRPNSLLNVWKARSCLVSSRNGWLLFC